MLRDNHDDKVWVATVVALAVLVSIALTSWRVDAQSLDGSSMLPVDSPSRVLTASPAGDPLTAASPNSLAADDEETTATAVDGSAAPPESEDSPDDYTPDSAAPSDADNPPAPGSENDAVLELPQVVSLPSIAGAGAPDGSSADSGGNDTISQSAPTDQQSSDDQELAEEPDDVGTLQDYENQGAMPPMGAIFLAPGFTVVRLPSSPSLNPIAPSPPWGSFSPPWGPPMLNSSIILPPTSSGPFPSTSPMLMGSRFAAPRSSFRGGGWMRARR
jgi:hypothetical protein